MTTSIALLGAGGKMGCRITDNLKNDDRFEVRYVEISEVGIARLAERGVQPTPEDEAIAGAEAVILALPDVLIGKVSAAVVPKLEAGTLVIGLDPAAAYAGVMPAREDIAYFVSHPCHPPLFNDDTDETARHDWFGGVHAAQSIVNALYQGEEHYYAMGEEIAKAMYQPIRRSHRITVEQMAILEPGIVETTMATLIAAAKKAMDRGIEMGVPRAAAEDFCSGHMRTIIAIIFGYAPFPFSDGAQQAVDLAEKEIFRDDWLERVMTVPAIQKQVQKITGQLPPDA